MGMFSIVTLVTLAVLLWHAVLAGVLIFVHEARKNSELLDKIEAIYKEGMEQ